MENSTDTSTNFVFETKCYYFHEKYTYSDSFEWNFIFIGITNILLAIFTGTLNIITLLVLYKSKPLHTPSNAFISGLAFWDTFTGVLTFPMNSVLNFLFSQAKSSCGLRLTLNFVGYFFGHCGLLTLALIATDRYIAVLHPYEYEIYTSSRRNILFALIIAWTISLIFVAGSFFTPKFMLYTIFVTITLILLLLWTVYSQGKILRVTRQILREIRPTANATKEEDNSAGDLRSSHYANHSNNNNNANDNIIIRNIPTAESTRAELREIKRKARDNLKAIKVTVLIVGAQYVCYLPHGIVVILYLVITPTTTLHIAHGWTGTLALMNSTLNPLIYCWQLKGFIRAAKAFLGRREEVIEAHFNTVSGP